MIRAAQDLVRQFMVEKGYMPEPPTKPTHLDPKLAEQRHDFLEEENREYLQAVLAGDLTAVADAIADALYIVLGTAVSHGIDLQPIFDAVHRSNMTKAPVDAVSGKGSKGPDYVPPTAEIASDLLRQMTGLPEASELRVTEFPHEDDETNAGVLELAHLAWANHQQTCAECRPHLGHLPFGLCSEGKALFFNLR
jgi:NTP pyrophosphatase (non-canonical NTP hydrolase)